MTAPSRKHLSLNQIIDVRRSERMARIDAMSPDLRACVHDYGLTIVDACVQLGITKPRHIRHLVTTILAEQSSTAEGFSIQGIREKPGPLTPTP